MFYFQSTLAGTGPSGGVSTDVEAFPLAPADKNTPLLMSTTFGVAQTSLAQAYTQSVAGYSLIRIWVTPALASQVLRGSQSGYKITLGAMENNAGMDLYAPRAFVYVWRSGSGNVKTIIAPVSSATETTTAERGFISYGTGTAGDFQILDGDRIVVEVWADMRNVLNTAYTATFYWGGPTDIQHNVANVNVNSGFYSPQSLDLYVSPTDPTEEPINGLTFLTLALTGLVVTLVYWLRHTLVPGILSVLAMLGTGFYWITLGTVLPILAYVWITIGLVNLIDFIIRLAFTFGNAIADQYGYRFDWLRSNEDDT